MINLDNHNKILNLNTYNPNKQYIIVSTDVIDTILSIYSIINNDIKKTKNEILNVFASVVDISIQMEDKKLELESVELYDCLEQILYK